MDILLSVSPNSFRGVRAISIWGGINMNQYKASVSKQLELLEGGNEKKQQHLDTTRLRIPYLYTGQ